MLELDGRPIEVETERLRLRPLHPSDVEEAYVEALNDPEVNRYLVVVRVIRQTRESVVAYVEQNRADPHGMLLGMFLKPGEPLIGTIRLHNIDPLHGTGIVGICVFKSYWRQRFGAEAIAGLTGWAFAHAPIRYLEAGCYEANEASRNAFLRAGFTVAARFDEKYLLDGAPAPVLILKCTAPVHAAMGSVSAQPASGRLE
jgi:RimJ/RimL family protein N-acetyltransferase